MVDNCRIRQTTVCENSNNIKLRNQQIIYVNNKKDISFYAYYKNFAITKKELMIN